ncbi:MAG: DNA-directed RNA polymerase I subunit RPA2 [Sarcosagium campestre]|nr:MAG: DNA-directed RNA polymerase I subunit RPA2 [Sarcosagium campestre]
MTSRASRSAVATTWGTEFDTVRREKLFRNPPKDGTAYPAVREAVQPHVDSFNVLLEPNGILQHALTDIGTKIFLDGVPGDRIRNQLHVRAKEVYLVRPHIPVTNKFSTSNREILPSECRERHASYRGKFSVRLEFKVNDGAWKEIIRELGNLPIMLKSSRCHLEKLTPAKLVRSKEESEEQGGYFIVNGIEKIIRMLIVGKRNHPMAVIRPSFGKRGPMYTKFGVSIRSVRPDQTSQTDVVHYLNDGNIIFRFSWRKGEYLIPVVMILKALVECSDSDIYKGIIGSNAADAAQNSFLTDRVELLLRTYKVYNVHTRLKARQYLGEKFKAQLRIPETVPDEQAGSEFLRKIVLPHLGNHNVTDVQDKDKFKQLLFMIRKLYALVAGDCSEDNPDAVQNQEILLGGFLYGMIIKEKIEEWILSIRIAATEWAAKNGNFNSPNFVKEFGAKVLGRTNEAVGAALEYFLSTGNLVSPTGLDLQQVSGYTIVAERINYHRFISHFRAVHRGSFFTEMKTTTTRKLLPESWGFLCPVHTPDGVPCGLLNHFAHKCKLTTRVLDVSKIEGIVSRLGVDSAFSPSSAESVVIQLDGRILGWCSPKQAKHISDVLRHWKVEGGHGIPRQLEIGYIPGSSGGQYPGIYISSLQARMVRPVLYLPLDREDFVGPLEQPYMSIACTKSDIVSGESTHVEHHPTNVLSILANMTPFSNFNQSPRNMYQCQMSKQTMGTSGTALRYRADDKTYRLQTGQTPVVRAPLHNVYGLDHHPNGMNAVVAVISYTGYDMDDAMIINKSAHERGFAHGSIYTTKKYRLHDGDRMRSNKSVTKLFGFPPGAEIKPEWREHLDEDGLPYVGTMVREGDIVAASHTVTLDSATGKWVNHDGVTNLHRYSSAETAYVEEVRLLGNENGVEPCTSISVKYRVPRSPVIGDKFSSRHGQKGVCSQKWPAVDMPFSESGMQPDLIINPHAFPSRMTIGMFIESLAGKAGALHGLAQDSTPFRFSEQDTALDYFGEQLKQAGYNFHGNETMYSGITGEELHADIYLGVVYYQRLRHMVNDKFQVRTTGGIMPLTGQPSFGRQRGGGIRFGEMERDSLLAHGTSYLLQDRLLNCSDYTRAWICKQCGSFFSITPTVPEYGGRRYKATGTVRCRHCARKADGSEGRTDVWKDATGERWTGGDQTTVLAVPGVLKYLDVELAAMGVRMKFNVTP